MRFVSEAILNESHYFLSPSGGIYRDGKLIHQTPPIQNKKTNKKGQKYILLRPNLSAAIEKFNSITKKGQTIA